MSDSLQIFSEFLGTAILVLLGDGVVAGVNLKKSKAEGAGWIAITVGWGMGLAMAVYIAGFMGPAHINPAVTLAFAAMGDFSVGLVVPFIIAQILGGIVGATIVWLAYMPLWSETDDADGILASFATAPAVRHFTANMVTEIIGTFVLVLGLLSLGENDLSDGFNPLLIGILVLSIGLSLGGPTGYAINPARDLGPRIAHQILPIANKGTSDWSYSWVPIVGPIVGGLVAAGVFSLIPF
ncbi:MIP/aquaporin family protein [Tetragenococcus halophilus]|uniref:MIP family channel protein n=1 Tax=Tetragenococcus halophilus TaxID=51669 RepID=A0AB37D2T5_TETHA|nr:MIP/aquaporin family protein [Tetragenococcus halophilus]MCF1601793.1 aquaporin family protein [Tetragenococcus halophilus]MCO8284705.1 aquaporin family protein [Tetragenococcus halophilus]MDN5832184.1 aquaporin family protein [Tetragenococcus halophilus]MDN6129663.1 aquaporin family protein [Tetragenococcus halophilus]MDN6726068.1 aquaporin family protein [Tetragenococcus halophilus]